MKKIVELLKKIPLSVAMVVLLVLFVLFFANPFTMLSDMCSHVTKEEIVGNEGTVITGVETMGKLKVLKRFVGGFLEIPSDVPENANDRKHFRVVYQWEGSAEFIINLSEIVRETNAVDKCIVLHMPQIEVDNLREISIAGTRCVIKTASLGYGDKADAILGSISQLVAKRLRYEVYTQENILKARNQAEYLLKAMVTATRPGVEVQFVWGEQEIRKNL